MLLASAATSSKGKLPASASSATSAVPGSSISRVLSTTGDTTFESVSTHIAAEAHRQVLEATLLSPPGTEYAHAVSAPTQSGHGGVNPVMGLQCTKNNPSGTYCDMPLDDNNTCGVANHDRAHCFKLGGGMAGQQPAHWRLLSCTKYVWYRGHRDHISCIPKTEELFKNIFIGLKHLELRKRKIAEVIPRTGYNEFKKDSDANNMTIQQYYRETYNIHIK